jgi:hypothetical protein
MAAARPMPREAPVTSATRGDPSSADTLNRHSLRHLLGCLRGMIAGWRETTGSRRVAAASIALNL